MVRSWQGWLGSWWLVTGWLLAQGADPWCDDEALVATIVARATALREAGRLGPAAELAAAAATAKVLRLPAGTGVPPAPGAPLEVEALCARLRASVRIVGHYYRCAECEAWHFSGSSGFCIGRPGLVATCRHVLAPAADMREASLVVADLAGHVWPVTGVVAADPGADLCVLEVPDSQGQPLPWAATVRQGQAVYCMSHPDHQFGYFSAGRVARLCRLRDLPPDGGEPAPDAPIRPWLQVTCEFAMGSSGAPIVDATGAVVGVAAATQTIVCGELDEVGDTQLVLRSAVPVAALAALLPVAADPPQVRGSPDK